MPFCSLPETLARFSAHLRQKKAGGDTEGEEYRLDDLMGGEYKEEPEGLRVKICRMSIAPLI